MNDVARKGRARQSGAIELVLRQLEARKSAEGEQAEDSRVLQASSAGQDRPRPVFYPTKGPATVPPECCRPWQMADRPEAEFDHLDELAQSMTKEGQIQPAVVRPLQDPTHPEIRYEVIAGQARWRAAKKAGTALDVVIHPRMDDEAAFRTMVGENEFRRGLSDFARAKRFAAALERGIYANKGEMAEKLRISPAQLSYFLGFAQLDSRVVARIRNIGAIPARSGYVMNQLARGEGVDWLLEQLPRIEAGKVTRADLEARLRGKEDRENLEIGPVVKEPARKASTVVADARGVRLFSYLVDARKPTTVAIPAAVARKLDQEFWEELRALLERRLR